MRKTVRVLMDVRGRLGAYREPMAVDARRLVARFARELGLDGNQEVSLLLTDNPTMRRLNRLWRQIDRQEITGAHPPGTAGMGIGVEPRGDEIALDRSKTTSTRRTTNWR